MDIIMLGIFASLDTASAGEKTWSNYCACTVVDLNLLVFTARRYASTLYAVVVYPSVCLSLANTVPKRINVGSHKQRHTIAQGLLLVF